MKDSATNESKSKLDTGLETRKVKKQIDLKFTDYSINKYQSDFSTGKKTIKTSNTSP